MNWYYEESGHEIGPLSDEAFQEEVRSGKVTQDTLVWNHTFSGWKSYGSITSVPSLPRVVPTKKCSQCGKSYPPDDLIEYSGSLICASCKSAFFQILKETGASPSRADGVAQYFPVSNLKLALMSVATLGFYEIYWFYKNWEMIKDRTGDDIRPFWRAVFAVFFVHKLFRSIHEMAETQRAPNKWRPGLLAWIFILLNVTWRLPDPFWLITYLSFIPLLYVQQTVNEINLRVAAYADQNSRFTPANIGAMVFGSILFFLILAGMLLPEN